MVRSLDNKGRELKKRDEPVKTQKLSPKRNKEVLKEKKELKKKRSFLEPKPLTQIYEEVAHEEEVSDPDSPVHELKAEEEIDWNLSREQQEMVQNTLKKYDMSEDVWRNYILTKIQGDAQLRRMGINVPAQKVDTQIETIRFVEELE